MQFGAKKMKTIKQLEKEINALKDNFINYPYIKKEYKKIDEDDLIKSKAQLQTLKEVLKEIDEWKNSLFKIVDYHKNHGDSSIIVRAELIKKIEELKQKLVGE